MPRGSLKLCRLCRRVIQHRARRSRVFCNLLVSTNLCPGNVSRGKNGKGSSVQSEMLKIISPSPREKEIKRKHASACQVMNATRPPSIVFPPSISTRNSSMIIWLDISRAARKPPPWSPKSRCRHRLCPLAYETGKYGSRKKGRRKRGVAQCSLDGQIDAYNKERGK